MPMDDFPLAYNPSAAAAAEERYILKALSYTGDTLDHTSQSQTQSNTFDTKAADKIIAKHKQALADAAAAGRKHIIDIGPKPAKFDPYSPHTMYSPGPGFEHFRDGFKVNEHGLVMPLVDLPERPPGW